MNRVELIYDADCPNVTVARQQLVRAFAALGMTPHWQEWERGRMSNPAYVLDFASPTILVNGCDVAQNSVITGSGACRVYTDEAGRLSGVPELGNITAALSAAETTAPAAPVPVATMKRSLLALPTVGFALLVGASLWNSWPTAVRGSCPACVPDELRSINEHRPDGVPIK